MAEPTRAARGGGETWVSVGSRDQRVRVRVRGPTEAATQAAADDLPMEMLDGRMASDGRVTLDEWLMSWISAREVAGEERPKTITGYLTDAKWVSRTIGGVRLCGLTPEHIESLDGAVRRADRSTGTVLHVCRTVRAALQTAVDRGRINRNRVSLAEAPDDDAPEVEPLDGSDVQAVLTAPAESGPVPDGCSPS